MDIKLPNLGEGADSGTVVNLFVKEGDVVAKDQAILELENEKAVASIPSSAAGTVSKVYVKVGDKISVGTRLISIGEAGGAPAAAPTKTIAAPPEEREREPIQTPSPQQDPGAGVEPLEPKAGQPVAAAPSIRKLARDLGIDLTRVRGSARGGRIVLEDVRAYIQYLQKAAFQSKGAAAGAAAPKPPAERIDFSKWGAVEAKPLSPLRQVIARRMSENWNAIPHVTQFADADITALNALRKKYSAAYEKKGTRLTLTSFAVRAVVEALRKHPIFNSSLDEVSQEIVLKKYYHIGIAVDTEAGLIVPVIRNADSKSLLDISLELEALAQRARDRKVSSEDLKGGTFTISNQGGIGGAHFTPIVNKPEVAILGLGRGAMKPTVTGGGIEARLLMPIGLSYDHRVIDGGTAARFTVDLVAAFENFKEEDVKI
jgi:pyruvate dehydrogenase E2 component (dihydrolipoamide acetyltransferase)